jgi:peptide/nickel transport system substrate-binding protein/microcin C transport system substrate-binding protein
MRRLGWMLLILVIAVGCNKRVRKNIAFYAKLDAEPGTLNPLTYTDGYASEVHAYTLDSMLSKNIDTYEWEAALAHKWEISKDKSKFKFWLKEGVQFHDGSEVTAKDVEYTFNAFLDDKTWKNAHKKFSYTNIKSVKAISKYVVEAEVKTKVYSNFDTIAGMSVISQKFYSQKQKKSFFNKNIMGTGPYKLEKWHRGNRIVLVRNEKWWGRKDPTVSMQWNYPKVVIKWISDATVAIEMLKKGKYDMVGMQPEAYVKKATGPLWGKEVFKVKTKNNAPKGYCYIGMNLKDPILKDKVVRKAMYHLLNRKLMIEKFEFNMSTPAVGPIYPNSPYASKGIKPVQFNPKKALEMLKSRGWKDTNRDGILDKNGKKLSITLLEPGSYSRYLTIFKEDAKKAGVEINIKKIEWNSFLKLVTQEKNFEMCRLCWSASVDWDPLQIWHTKSIEGGSNFISYSNKKVDDLIDKARLVFERSERIKLLSKVEKQIIEDVPYLFISYKDTTLYGHTKRILKEKDTYEYGIGTNFWKFKNTQTLTAE